MDASREMLEGSLDGEAAGFEIDPFAQPEISNAETTPVKVKIRTRNFYRALTPDCEYAPRLTHNTESSVSPALTPILR